MCAKRLIDPLQGIMARLAANESELERPRSLADWGAWRQKTQSRLRAGLGEWPELVPLEAEETERVDEGDHWRIRILYDADAFSTVPAWLLLPKDIKPGEKRAAILCAHGHGRGKDDVVGYVDPTLPADERTRGLKSIESHNYDYARQLVRRGYVCFAPDWRGFGERMAPTQWAGPDPNRWASDPCDVIYMAYGYFGYELLALNIWDGMRAIDYLIGRADVDGDRIGCIGLSFGGTMATFLPAIDERIKVVDVVCYLSTIGDALSLRGRVNTCGSQYMRGLLRYGDISSILGLIAPRPLLAEMGELDEGFAVEDAMLCYQQTAEIYASAGAADRIDYDRFPGGHMFSGRKAFDFFERWLGPAAR